MEKGTKLIETVSEIQKYLPDGKEILYKSSKAYYDFLKAFVIVLFLAVNNRIASGRLFA